MSPWTAYGLAWLATGVVVAVAIYITQSAMPLWAMFLPLLIDIKVG